MLGQDDSSHATFHYRNANKWVPQWLSQRQGWGSKEQIVKTKRLFPIIIIIKKRIGFYLITTFPRQSPRIDLNYLSHLLNLSYNPKKIIKIIITKTIIQISIFLSKQTYLPDTTSISCDKTDKNPTKSICYNRDL